MSEQEKRGDARPAFTTDSVDDLHELLGRAAKYAGEGLNRPGIAAEFEDAREFVEDELQDDDPELVTDGGQSETEISQTFRCECGGEVERVDYLPMGTGESTHFRCTECNELGIRDIIPSPSGGERLRGVVRRAE